MHRYTDEQKNFILNNYKDIATKELTNKFNKEFATNVTTSMIRAYKKNHKLSSGLTGQFKKGHIPANKGKKMSQELYDKARATMFKKGNVSANRVPIGSERDDKDGYIQVKVQDGKLNKNWKFKQVKIWEDEHGPLPKGHIVIFLDGNNRNFDLTNLKAISKATNARMNQNHLRYNYKELTEVGVTVAEVLTAVASAKRRKEKQNDN